VKIARRTTQLAFLILTLVGVFALRGDAERWCPFGGVEALWQYAREGSLICSLGISNFYILAAVLLLTLILRRAFCGYMCPIGTLSEWIQRGARLLGFRAAAIPYKLDRALAMLKYPVLAVILYFTWRAGELVFRGYDPCYALIGRHGDDITLWAYVISGAIVVASALIAVPFCRWLCPLAAVLAPFSRVGLTRIKRGEHACIDCGACARACPMAIRVDRAKEVTASRCTSCFECIDACLTRNDGALTWGPPKWLGIRWPRGVLIAVLLACLAAAVATTYALPLPSFVWTRGDPPAHTVTVTLQVDELTCRGRANLFTDLLEREDLLEIPGYLDVEAWPAPAAAPVRITYDPAQTDEGTLKAALTTPYFDTRAKTWRNSPFRIIGYDPAGSD
jgi:ferredoxin